MISLDFPATYLHWGIILISVPNLVVILLMVLVFVLAVVTPMPGQRSGEDDRP